MRVVSSAPAKVNLCLFVLDKRSDGYHDIISLVQKISIYDTIELELNSKRKNEVKYKLKYEHEKLNTLFAGEIKVGQDTVSIALDEISSITGRFYSACIRKRIPIGAGLGGASSDAAEVIKIIGELEGIKNEKLYEISLKVGSDVPLFLGKTPAIISGRGERVNKIDIEEIPKFFVVIFPGFISSTSKVYAELDKIRDTNKEGKSGNLDLMEDERKRKLSIIKSKIWGGVISAKEFWEILGWNDLEMPFSSIYELSYLRNEIEEVSQKKFFLTGSGSSFFSCFPDKVEAQEVYMKLKERNFIAFFAEAVD